MDLIITLVIAGIIGVIGFYITTWPMESGIKLMIRIATVIVLALWMLSRFGVVIPNVMP